MEKGAAVAALAALAQETRLDVFRMLVEAGPEGLSAGTIGEALGLPGATLSFHLNQLRQAGLAGFERQGRSLIYSARYPAMAALMRYLTDNCCRGDAEGCAVADCKPSDCLSGEARTEGANRHETHTRARRR